MKTFGKLSHDAEKKLWLIESTPDIVMRLHRIFPRMARPDSTHLSARDTLEMGNDIEWMMQRYPMEFANGAKDRMEGDAKGYRESLERVLALHRAPPRGDSFKLSIPPRDYQALATAIYLEQGFLLDGDVVGLGKTLVAIASFTDNRALPALVVVKAHLPKQWKDEIGKFLPAAKVHIISKSQPYPLPDADVYVISYSKLSGWWGDLSVKCQSIVFDEMQELRHSDSNKYRAAKAICENVKFRLGLSATPIHNYGDEIWTLYNLLAPDKLGTYGEFTREWCSSGGVVVDPDALGHYLRNQNLFVRRTRRDVGRELPPIMRFVQTVEHDALAYEKATSTAAQLAKVILSGTFLERGQAARQFDLEVRQATGVAKAPYVADLVRMLVESGEKVLLSGWHRAVYDVWLDRLRDLNPLLFTGTESANQKEKAKQDFINLPNRNLLIMSNRSGAGIDGLQEVCSCCVIGELDWTPAVQNQFIGRLARDGQKEPVEVFIPVCAVGSDPTMAQVLGLKTAQADGIVDLGVNISEGTDFTETDPQRVKQLAENFLKMRGEDVDKIVNNRVDEISVTS